MSNEAVAPAVWDDRLRDLTQVTQTGPLQFESLSEVGSRDLPRRRSHRLWDARCLAASSWRRP